MKRVWLALAVMMGGLPVAASTTPAAAQTGGFQASIAIRGLDTPTALRFASDGRVFVAEKSGLIKVFDSLTDTTPTIFADLSTNVYNYFDRGLLGIELHPDFPATPYVYALYTHDAEIGGTAPKWGTPGVLSDPCPDPPGDNTNGCVVSGRLTRLEASGNTMVGTERVLIEDWCQQFPSHSVGTVTFGPDGALYVGAGDGALAQDWGQRGDPVNPCGDPPGGVGGVMEPPSAEGGALRSQDLRTSSDPVGLDGTIIRVDPITGEGLATNPLAGSADANERRVIAYGLRNPFRFAFRPGTNEIYVGDVGQGRYEEIDRIPAPGDATVENFGWPCYEGSPRFAPFDNRDFTICEQMYGTPATTAPWFTYHHNNLLYADDPCPAGSGVLTGMEFYEGGSYPSRFEGALFFADYSRSCIWVMFEHTNGQFDEASVQALVSNAGYPVDLQIGPGGDLFYVDIGFGQVKRVQYFAENQPPTAVISATPSSGYAPLTVQFDGTGSWDPENGPLTYEWDLDGDGAYDDSTDPQPTYVYHEPRDYTVGLRVTDDQGAQAVESLVVSAGNNAPVPSIVQPSSSFTWHAGEPIEFSGEATDAEDGSLPASALSWSWILHHCSASDCHAHFLQDFVGQASGTFPALDHEYPSHLELRLTATDSAGLSATSSMLLQPETVDITIDSVPSGLQIGFGSDTAATPFTRTVIVNSSNSVTAPSPQTLAGSPYVFASWSDGGAQTHEVVAPASPSSYVANYVLDNLVEVSITDNGYDPRNLIASRYPLTVRWINNGTRGHTATDGSGMGLFDSGLLAPGERFSFEFLTAGRYPYRSTAESDTMTGSVQVPMFVSPASGDTATSFELTWAARVPDGYVMDVQIQRPGSTSWWTWRRGQTVTGGNFVPDAGVGTYRFRARLRNASNGRSTAYSNPVAITVG